MTNVRTGGEPVVTYTLIALNVIAFVAELASGSAVAQRGGGRVIADGALYGPAIANADEYWRLVTSGFLHAGCIHILFNMYFLWLLGTQLEPAVGRVRFAVLYFVSLLAGSFGALLFSSSLAATTGASGAVFGLMAAAFVLQRARGIDPMQSGLGVVILLNLGITFLIPGISIGAHLGGLIGGGLAALAIERVGRGRITSLVPVLACAVIAVFSFGAAIAVADHKAADIGLAALGLFA
jgi:membrane associated rhomboid family serine protease